MTIKTRLKALEKASKPAREKIDVHIIDDDDSDPNYVIIDPYGPNPRRVSKAEYDAEIKALEAAGVIVVIVAYKDQEAT